VADAANPSPEPMDWDKATPEQAYVEAQRRIAAAKASEASEFTFDLKMLAAIPPEIVQLGHVRKMHLGDAAIADLRPLAGLTNLKELHIYRVPVMDISPLCVLTGLEYLALSQVPATDFAALGRMTFLKILALEYGMPITNLAFLAPLEGLETLVLSETRGLSDLAPLARLKNLRFLDVSDTQVSDLSALADLPFLATLWLRNTPVSDIEPLSRLTSLKVLDLAGTLVANLSPLAKLKELTVLNLDGTQVSDLRPLENATNLRTLNIEETGVSDLGPIAEFRAMIDQWTTNEEGDEADCAWDEEEEYERRGLHYRDTPLARHQPYCWLVALTPGRRTIETINYVRAARSLATYWPEEYEPAEGSIFDSNRGPKEEIRDLLRKIQEKLRVGAPLAGFTNRIFVVHGHDHELKDNVAAFLDGLGLESVVLHREANRGQTIIEKFEQSAEVGFAVVLLTPDDAVAGGGRRARQNVILELGYFIGRLGRHRVCALKKGDVELPSDILGVLFTSVDAAGQWQAELRRELEAAEYELRR
jgi:Leucine-rich repeat (LRR) protein